MDICLAVRACIFCSFSLGTPPAPVIASCQCRAHLATGAATVVMLHSGMCLSRNPCTLENVIMQIQVNTSNGIDNTQALTRWAEAELKDVLSYFKSDLTRIEVHLSNESASKAGGDIRCNLEARLVQHQTVAVSHHAPTQDAAFRGASDKLKNALDKNLGRLRSQRNHESLARDGVVAEE